MAPSPLQEMLKAILSANVLIQIAQDLSKTKNTSKLI
jgi:hypothetical protein